MTGESGIPPGLLEAALGDNEESLSVLAEQVRERVYPYLRRVLLDEHQAEDLAQDTVMAVLNKLDHFEVDRPFWPWVYRIATNNLRQFCRGQRRHKTVAIGDIDEQGLPPIAVPEPWLAAAQEEMARIAQDALARINKRYRMVLVLRVFEGFSFAEMAEILGCSQLTARVLFFRGKRALRRELDQRGIRGASILAALIAFGQWTQSPEASAAAPRFNPTVWNVGLVSGLKSPAAIGLAAVIAGFALLHSLGAGKQIGPTAQPATPVQSGATLPPPGQPLWVRRVSDSDFNRPVRAPVLNEFLTYFPEGLGGPKFWVLREPGESNTANTHISNPEGWYTLSPRNRVVYIWMTQSAMKDEATPWGLMDPADLRDFIEQQDRPNQAERQPVRVERDPETGLVTGGYDARPGGQPYSFKLEYLTDGPLDFMHVTVPEGWRVEDKRDAMHQRGWTVFRISGRILDEEVSGVGQIPFTYNESQTHPMWFRMTVGNRLTVLARENMAVILDAKGNVLRVVGAGSLLKGLPRPWQMSHPMDSIRRDAATDRLSYGVLACEDNRFKVRVRKRQAVGGGSPEAELYADYVGAMKTDLLRRIIFRTETQEDALAELAFSCAEGACEDNAEFARPEFPKLDSSQVIEKTDMFWPLCLPQTPIPGGQQLAGGEAPRPQPDAPE